MLTALILMSHEVATSLSVEISAAAMSVVPVSLKSTCSNTVDLWVTHSRSNIGWIQLPTLGSVDLGSSTPPKIDTSYTGGVSHRVSPDAEGSTKRNNLVKVASLCRSWLLPPHMPWVQRQPVDTDADTDTGTRHRQAARRGSTTGNTM